MLGNLPLAIAAGAKADRGMTQSDLVPHVDSIERDVTWWIMLGRNLTVRMCRTEEEARYWLRITRRDKDRGAYIDRVTTTRERLKD